jgi:hypothetical protein
MMLGIEVRSPRPNVIVSAATLPQEVVRGSGRAHEETDS